MTKRSEERRQFLWDVFVTALEGGIGYWSFAETYHLWIGGNGPDGDLDGFYADIKDFEDDNKPYRIDRDVITRGLGRIMRAQAPYYDPNGARTQCERVKFLDKGTASIVRSAAHDNDGGEIDAGVADCIVQAGLFGEIVYG